MQTAPADTQSTYVSADCSPATYPSLDSAADGEVLRSTVLNQLDRSKHAELRDLLRLIGTGVGAERAYVLIPQTSSAGISVHRPIFRWRRISWTADSSIMKADVTLPIAFRHFISASGNVTEPERRDVMFSDEDREVLVALPGAGRELLGYLGFAYPEDRRPSSRRIQLLQDIVCSQLQSIGIAGISSRGSDTVQEALAQKSHPALILTGGRVTCVNDAAVRLLGGHNRENVHDRPLDDFFAASETQIINDHLVGLSPSGDEASIVCAVVGLDGTERRVKATCRRMLFRGLRSVEMVLEPIAGRRNVPDPLIDSISEAVWHVRLLHPVPTSAPFAAQVQAIRRSGSLAESNRTLAEYYETGSVENLLGLDVHRLLPTGARRLVEEFVASQYNLRGFEYRVRDRNDRVRLFTINAMGTMEDGHLTDIWGSCKEVSDRLELEKKSISLQEEQKQRIGRDLHDSVAPLLTGMRLLSGDMIENGHLSNATFQTKIEKLAGFVEEASERLCEIYRGLVPRILEERSLAEALEDLAENMTDMSGVTVFVSRDASVDVERQDEKVQLYRIVQEAVNNALKHAASETIEISLRRRHNHVLLEIKDDGTGFEVDQTKIHSLGLENMRLRAATIGAEFSVHSLPGEGTTVSVSLTKA